MNFYRCIAASVHRRYPSGFPLFAPETACICRFLCFRAVLPDVPSATEALLLRSFRLFLFLWNYGFCRLPAVRCYYGFFVCKTSPGKRNRFHIIYLLHLRLEFRAVSDFVLSCKLVHFKTPFMQFLFVRPRFCLRLLSDSASRRTPLSLANSSYYHACSGLSPPSYYTCRAHKQFRRE